MPNLIQLSSTLEQTKYVAPNVNVHNTLTSAVEGKRGASAGGGAEPLLNLRRGPVPHPLLINDRFFSGYNFSIGILYKWKNLKAIQACILTFQRAIANIERNNLMAVSHLVAHMQRHH